MIDNQMDGVTWWEGGGKSANKKGENKISVLRQRENALLEKYIPLRNKSPMGLDPL